MALWTLLVAVTYVLFCQSAVNSIDNNQGCSWDDGLKQLDCSYRNLVSTPDDIRRDTRVLILKHNDIVEVPSYAFEESPDLEVLYLDDNNIETLSADSFAGLSSLVKLYLSGNPLRELPSTVFQPLRRLETLKLARMTNLQSFPSALFHNLTRLTTLYMADNVGISRIPSGTFSGLTSLDSLDLYGNSISEIQPGTFSDLQKLSYLSFAANRLPTIPDGLFNGLNNLYQLDLQLNQIQSVHTNAFSELITLSNVDLSNNRLRQVPTAVSQLHNLKTLQIRNNQITDLSPDTFIHVTKIKTLRLEGNNFTSIPDVFTSRTSNSQNNIFQQLLYLSLWSNPVRHIDGFAFDRLTSLEELQLGHMNLEGIDTDAFIGLGNLRRLGLDNNRLFTLTSHTVAALTQLQNIWLHHNVWNCDCSFYELLNFIQTSTTPPVIVDDGESNSVCALPLDLRGTPVSQFMTSDEPSCSGTPTDSVSMATTPAARSETHCSSSPTLVLAICVPMTVISIVITIVVVILWRRQISNTKQPAGVHFIPYTDDYGSHLSTNGSERHPGSFHPGGSSSTGQADYADVESLRGHTYQTLRSPTQLETSDGYLIPVSSINLPNRDRIMAT